jgi:hypothetical protein
MISLHAFGALNRCTAFNPELDPKRISQLLVFEEDVSTRSFIKENLQALENRQEDQELRQALLRILNPSRPRWQLKAMREVRRVGRQIQSIWG